MIRFKVIYARGPAPIYNAKFGFDRVALIEYCIPDNVSRLIGSGARRPIE